MTAKQKAAREKFKKVVAEASKLRKKNPKLTQAQAVKQAWAIQYSKEGKGKKVAAIKIIEKGESKSAKAKATYQQVRSKKGTFKGLKKVGYDQEVTGSDFTRISNDTFGNPRYVIHFLNVDRDYDKAVKIANKVGGKKFNNKQYGGGIVFQSYNIDETARYLNNAISKNKKIGAASSKVKARKGKSTEMHTDTKSHNVNIRVVSGMKRDDGYIGKAIIKKYTISEIKKLNPIYFNKGLDAAFGVYARKLMVSPKLNSQVMIEAHKNYFGGEVVRDYSVRQISSDGKIERPQIFNNLFAASNYVGKNIIL